MTKTMLMLTVVLTMLFCVATVAQAHPPSDITLKYDQKTHILTVTALHNTLDPTTHYIKLIEVSINGAPMITQNFLSQTDKATQQAQYIIIDLKPGDTIVAKATCSIRGSLEKPLILPKVPDTTK